MVRAVPIWIDLQQIAHALLNEEMEPILFNEYARLLNEEMEPILFNEYARLFFETWPDGNECQPKELHNIAENLSPDAVLFFKAIVAALGDTDEDGP
jgi:hypothetical protein